MVLWLFYLTKFLKGTLNTSSVSAQSISVTREWWVSPFSSSRLNLDACGILFPLHAVFFKISSHLCVSVRCGLPAAIILSQAGWWCGSNTQDKAHTLKHTCVQTCPGSLTVTVWFMWRVSPWLCTHMGGFCMVLTQIRELLPVGTAKVSLVCIQRQANTLSESTYCWQLPSCLSSHLHILFI